MNEYPNLPIDIFMRLGISFIDVSNRIMANQYPYSINKRTIYFNRNTDFVKLFEETFEPTVWIIRNEKGKFLESIFVPMAFDTNPYSRIIINEQDIDKRIPQFINQSDKCTNIKTKKISNKKGHAV